MDNDRELLEYFLVKLSDYITIKTYKKNELIFNESDIADSLYIIKYGKVEVFKLTKTWEERIIFILQEGSVLNEEILCSNISFNEFSNGCATYCRAYDDVTLIAIPKNILLNCMQTDIKITNLLFASASRKLRRTYRQLKNSGTNTTIDKKIAAKLYRLSLEYGVEIQGEILIDIPLTSTTLSKMVGAKRETVSRCMNLFKKEGIILIDGDKITISNFNDLKSIFDSP